MKTSTKGWLIAGGTIAAIAVAVLFYVRVVIPAQYERSEWPGMLKEGIAQGQDAGRGMTDQQCFVEVSEKTKRKEVDVRNAEPWLHGCLSSSRKTVEFCEGVLDDEEDMDWQVASCKKRGIAEYCLFYMPTVMIECRSRKAVGPNP